MYEQKEKQKSSKNEVIQCYKIIDGRKVSDDESLWLQPGKKGTHRFWAKKGLFDEQAFWLDRSKIHLYKEQEEEEFDLITAEYKEKCADEMIAPSDCGDFTKLILGTEEPHAIFGLGSSLVETKQDPDPSGYKAELVKSFAEAIDSIFIGHYFDIYRESSSFVNTFIAPKLIPGHLWGIQEFKDAACYAIPQIVSESGQLFYEIMKEQSIKDYVLAECEKGKENLWGVKLMLSDRENLGKVNEENCKEILWGMKKVIHYLMGPKRSEIMIKLETLPADQLRRVCTQSVTLFGLVKKGGCGCLAPQIEQQKITIGLFKDAVKHMDQEQLERLISESPSLARYLHVNQYAVPLVGYGYVISSGGKDISGRSGRMWPHHWAGVVMESEDKKDQIVMENYYYGGEHNNLWQFDMVGTRKAGQSFHDIHKDGRLHGDTPVTMIAAY